MTKSTPPEKHLISLPDTYEFGDVWTVEYTPNDSPGQTVQETIIIGRSQANEHVVLHVDQGSRLGYVLSRNKFMGKVKKFPKTIELWRFIGNSRELFDTSGIFR